MKIALQHCNGGESALIKTVRLGLVPIGAITKPCSMCSTHRQTRLRHSCFPILLSCPLTLKQIDFEKVHVLANYKDAKNAKVMFGRLLTKLSGGKEKPGSPAAKGAKAAAKPQGVTKTKAEVGKRGRKKKGVIDEFAAENDGNITEGAGDEGVTKEMGDEGE